MASSRLRFDLCRSFDCGHLSDHQTSEISAQRFRSLDPLLEKAPSSLASYLPIDRLRLHVLDALSVGRFRRILRLLFLHAVRSISAVFFPFSVENSHKDVILTLGFYLFEFFSTAIGVILWKARFF